MHYRSWIRNILLLLLLFAFVLYRYPANVSSDTIPNSAPRFIETGGMVVFEGQHFDSNISRNNHIWANGSDTNAVGATFINTKNDGLLFTPPNSAETQYLINFSTTGTYYVWLRGFAPSGTSNAIGVGLDGVPTASPINFRSYGSWIWDNTTSTGSPVKITVSSAGTHTFSVWEKKDGTKLDRIVLSTSSIAPSGIGPAESVKEIITPTPTIDPNLTPTETPTPTPTASPTPNPSLTPVPSPTPIINFTPLRFQENPLIVPSMLPGTDGGNVNGPSLIKVPDWLPNKLGMYYLYFANHSGTYIRLAYSNDLHGPWTVYTPGTLKLTQATACKDHIASPDVHVDNVSKEIRMYFHCPGKGGSAQYSFVAASANGKSFTAQTTRLGLPYFRVFEYGGYYYSIAKNESSSSPQSFLYRSTNPYSGFVKGNTILPGSRHTAVYLNGNTAYIFYSRIGDAPERILLSTMDITADWSTWTPSAPIEILRPEYNYEGSNLPISPSKYGEVDGPVNQLRDPGIYQEADKLYLLYSIAGEQGIAATELIMQ